MAEVSGAPLLLVHGLIGHMRVRQIFDYFGSRAHAPDLLGYGERGDWDGPISLRAQVEFLHQYCHDHELAPVHVAGHSVGGAIAVLLARKYPNHVASILNIEGNFTLKDAFWSKRIAESTLDDTARALEADRADPAGWLERCGVEATDERIDAARSHLNNQSAETVYACARSVVEVTGRPEYLRDVAAVLDYGTPMQLIAGERSEAQWDVPAFVRERAPLHILPNTGHLVTIESPQAFAQAVVFAIEGRPQHAGH